MRIVKYDSKDQTKCQELEFDENGDFVEARRIEYVIYLIMDEHRKCIDKLEKYIYIACREGFEVYISSSHLDRAKVCQPDEIVLSKDSIIDFSTTFAEKFDFFHDTVKNFVSEISECVALRK